MRDWNAQWDVWKVGHFATLQTEDMEGTTQETFKKIQKLQRELKVGWQILREDTWTEVLQYHLEYHLQSISRSSSRLVVMANSSLQDKDWEILDYCKKRIIQLKKIIPVISDLRNPAMRERCDDE